MIWLLQEDLWCDVGWRSTAVQDLILTCYDLRQAEVRDFHAFHLLIIAEVIRSLMCLLAIAIKLYQDILWFDIPM